MRGSNRTACLVAGLALLAGCGGVRVAPVTSLPSPLLEPEPVTIGVHYPEEFRWKARHVLTLQRSSGVVLQ
ncbi:MAG: hypothetical protein ACO3LH_09475, partial [Steroidobacteraceae bacterium]